jgi:hypothetical protein
LQSAKKLALVFADSRLDSRRENVAGESPDDEPSSEPPERETMMDGELEHMLNTYVDHKVISQQCGLRSLLTCLRSLAEQLQLDFEEALKESEAAFRHRLLAGVRQGL